MTLTDNKHPLVTQILSHHVALSPPNSYTRRVSYRANALVSENTKTKHKKRRANAFENAKCNVEL